MLLLYNKNGKKSIKLKALIQIKLKGENYAKENRSYAFNGYFACMRICHFGFCS